MKKFTLLSKVASVLLLFSMLCNYSVSARETTTYFVVPANPPTLTAVTITPVCAGKKATIVLTGLIPNSTGVATYSVNGVIRTVTGTANNSGVFTFLTQTLTLAANGSVVTVLKLKDNNTQLETTFTGKIATIVVSPYPTLTSISVSPVCAGSSAIVTLTGLVPNSVGTAFYKIGSQTASQFGTADVTGTFTINTLNLPESAHNLNIEITKIINNSGCETIFTGKIATLVVRALPSISVSNNGPYCEGSNVSLSASGATTYSWNGPLSFSSSDQNPSFTASATASGSYTVIATDDNGCVNTASTDVVVNPLPVVEITGSTAVCEGNSFNLTATGGATYAWRGAVGSSNGATSTRYTASTATINRDINGVNHYHRAGEYTVTATDANGCVNTASQTISVSPRLTLNTIPVIPPACEGSSFTINSIATITNVNRTNSWPYFALSAGNSNDISYAWSGPNGFTSSSSNASVSNASMNNAGTYSLTITGPGGCTKSADRNITINPLPTIELAASAAVCVGSDITLTATSNGTILSWFRNGTFLAFGSSYTISSADMSDAGSYTFRVRSNNLCVAEQSIDVTVNAVPTVVASSNSAICDATTLNLSASGATIYSWNGPLAFSSSDQNPSFTASVTASGSYTVIATDNNGCVNTASTDVVVNPLPVVEITGSTAVCEGNSFNLTATGGATYAWRGAVGSSNGATSTRYTASTATINRDINGVNHYHRAGEYTVTATDANGCVNTASQTISVSPRLTLNTIPVIPPACEGSSFTINSIATITNVNRTNSWPYFALSAGNSNDISYAWSGPNGFTSSSSNASVSNASMNNAGTYSLTVTGPGGCTKSADRNIIINPLPTIELAASAAVCVGSDITLTATSNGTILSWFRNGTFLAFGSSYTISSADMSDAGSYTFRARSNNLCVVEQSIDVTVNAVPTLLEIMIAPVCSGSSATVVLTGLLPTTNGIATYSINGGAPQIESGISDGNGRFSFNTPTLGMGQNNYTVEILSITNIETGCFTNFTGKTAILKVNPNPSLSTIETSPICSGSPATILLSGLLPNTNGTATYTINGGITQFQASGVSSSQGTFSFQTDPLPAAANGFTINIIKIRNVDTSCETSFTNKTVTLIVNASPTLAAITIAPIVKNNKATVVLSGLLKNQLGTATYTVNGGSEQQASGTSTSAGTFSFQTPTLGVAQNGWIVRIISIKNNDNLCETAFSNMQAPLAVTNSLRSENTPTVSNNEVIAPTFGLQNQAKIDIVLYPNPASDVLNIETALEVQSVIMLNINGQIVLSSNQKQVNVSALPAGIYMVQIKDAADNVTTKKIIIK